MHFTLLKKDYSETDLLDFLNPTNGIMLEAYSSNEKASVILAPTTSELSKQEFIETINAYIKNLEEIKVEVSKEYDKLNKLRR